MLIEIGTMNGVVCKINYNLYYTLQVNEIYEFSDWIK